jgi:ligand-binding SRPBCC domain-containing protein
MPRWQSARIEQASFAAPPLRPEGTPRYAATAAGAGSRITISFRAVPLIPIRLPWEALIEDFTWNEGFSDIQVRGPFKYWRHTHTIRTFSESSAESAVIVSDEVAYELPLGPFSGIANSLFVRPQLGRIFRYRQQRTAELLAAAAKIQSP